MNFFKNLNKSITTARLVESGLVNGETVTRKEILDCEFLVADVMRENWKIISKETAAGIVLVVLAKNALLKEFINTAGWELVSNLVKANPEFAKDMAAGTLAEISSYQVTGFA